MPLTIGEALSLMESRLKGSPGSPRAEAEELVGRLVGRSRTGLYLDRDLCLDRADEQRLEDWVARRLEGEPVQYITGRATFRGLDLEVSPAVLIPRPETEGVVEAVLELLRDARQTWPAPRVLELGTGSGAIALSLASECPWAAVTATEISPEALEVANANASALGLQGTVRFLRGSWFDPVPADEVFEVVVANPPYIATGEWADLPRDVRDHEPARALFSGPTGLEALREILDEAPLHLADSGWLALELAESRASEVASWLEGARHWESVAIRDDLAGRPRFLLARRQGGPAIAPRRWNEERR